MNKYEYKNIKGYNSPKFIENGHTMFETDVLQRLKRLSYLEDKIVKGELTEIQASDKPSNCILGDVSNRDFAETMHQCVFDVFHDLRAERGNPRYIKVDGKDINEIIRLGKIAAKTEHGC